MMTQMMTWPALLVIFFFYFKGTEAEGSNARHRSQLNHLLPYTTKERYYQSNPYIFPSQSSMGVTTTRGRETRQVI